MVKRTGKRILSLLMAATLMLSLLPMVRITALAASGTVSTSVEDLGASYANGNDLESVEGSGTSITCAASGYSRTIILLKLDYSSTTTLTLTNNKQSAAKLTFDYSFTTSTSGGSCTIDNTDVTNGKFEKTLNSGESVRVAVKSPKGEGNTSTLQITNISLVEQKNVTITFEPAQNGSYTVDDGSPITSQTLVTKDSTEGFVVKAVPAGGYKFMGWYSVTDDTYLSTSADTTLLVENSQTVVAKFIPSTKALFQVNSYVFDDLNQANSYATQVGAAQITVISSGEIPAGEYTISSGVTLLVPYSADTTIHTTEPLTVDSAGGKTAYRTLTISNGATINVNGAINVDSQVLKNTSKPAGPYGLITVETGGEIVLNSGANLYCWGYINGDGAVTAQNGSDVYECFQLSGWRGGQASLDMINNKEKVFPVSQYYIQNIEAALTLEYGASEWVYASVVVSLSFLGKYQPKTTAEFIGTSAGLFRLKEGGSITKKYIPSTDRMQFDVEGNLEINAMDLNLRVPSYSVNLVSGSYVLPINNNFTINVQSGTTTLPSNQDIALLPGAEFTVAERATFEVNSNMYIYDTQEWVGKNYAGVGAGDIIVSGYSTTNGTKTMRTAADLEDAKVDVNGTIKVGGGFYTTAGGADIISSQGSGQIIFNAPSENTLTHQVTQSDTKITYRDVPITSAMLHNGERYAGTEYEYTKTAGATGGTTYSYCTACDKWYTGEQHSHAAQIVNGAKAGKYETLTEALALYDAGSQGEAENDAGLPYIQMENNTRESSLIIDEPVYLDLNGHTVTLADGLTIAENGALYGMDSATEDYSGAGYGKIVGTVSGTGKVAVAHGTYRLAGGKVRRYVSYQNGDELSFHRYNMSVTNYQFYFRANGQCDMDFGATFRGSDTVVKLLADMGFKVEKTGTPDSAQGWWSTQNGDLPADLASGYVLRGTLINIGSNELAEFTQDYDIYALLKFQDDTVVESVPRNLNYLWALKKYYLSDEATAEKQAIIDQFVKDKNLTEAWDKIQIQ